MSTPSKPREPQGDPARHLEIAALVAGLRALPAPRATHGSVALIVRRLADGSRETPDSVRLCSEEGVPGDEWSRRPPRNPEAQLGVMQLGVAELIANGQPLTLFGDNLIVDLDLSAVNLPTGTLLRVGAAVVEVTPKPHDGCHKFRGRFGAAALRFVQAPPTRHLNLRGIYWSVVDPGEAQVGDAIEVMRRPS